MTKFATQAVGLVLFGFWVLASFAAAQQTIVTYTYDDLGRLENAEYGDQTEIDYVYDPNGNRTQLITTVDGVTPPEPPPPPQGGAEVVVIYFGGMFRTVILGQGT